MPSRNLGTRSFENSQLSKDAMRGPSSISCQSYSITAPPSSHTGGPYPPIEEKPWKPKGQGRQGWLTNIIPQVDKISDRNDMITQTDAPKATDKIQWFSSVQFSHSVVSNSLRSHESQHTRPPCPSPTPRVYLNTRPLSQWCHPAISSPVIPYSSCPQSLPASRSFPMSQLLAWGG